MKTAKLLALCLCLPLCLTACTQAEPSESSFESPSVSSSSESQSKEEPYKITLTDELVRANNANARNGGYIMEEERYIVYRNPADGGKLYRYEKETGEAKILYNTTATNGFLHSIEFFDNRIYFVTRTATDEVPTLYSVDIEGENLERIIENVGDDYILTNDAIYYTSAYDEGGAYFYMYKYDRKTGKSELMRNRQSEYLNLVGDEIYFVDYTFTGESETSGSGIICKINVKTNEFETVPVYDEQGREAYYIGRLFYYNGKLYFKAHVGSLESSVSSLLAYDLSTKKIKTLTNTKDLYNLTQTDQFEVYQFCVLDENDIYVYLSGIHDYAIIQLKDDEVITHKAYEINTDQLGYRSHRLCIIEKKPIAYISTKIIGAEKLMVKAGEA